MNKGIYFLNATRKKFGVKEKRKPRTLTPENIKAICDKSNWELATYEQIKENDYCLLVGIYDDTFKDEPEQTEEEIKQKVQSLAKELKEMYEKLTAEWNNGLKDFINNLEKDGSL